jgi:hypothetical protein
MEYVGEPEDFIYCDILVGLIAQAIGGYEIVKCGQVFHCISRVWCLQDGFFVKVGLCFIINVLAKIVLPY